MPVAIYQVVTFASRAFAGNPAFVVVLDEPRSAETMQALCRQLREPILAALHNEGDAIRLDYWTPAGTHPGPGHSTHAAAWVVFNRLRPAAGEVSLLLANGDIRKVHRDAGGLLSVNWPLMPFTAINATGELAGPLRRQPVETFRSDFGVIAIFSEESHVAGLEPDLDAMARLDTNTVIVTAPARSADFAIRVFAPKVGLPEDPVCGTAHRILMPLWAERFQRTELVSHQLSPRGGKLYCRLSDGLVTIGGEAMLFLEGSIALP